MNKKCNRRSSPVINLYPERDILAKLKLVNKMFPKQFLASSGNTNDYVVHI